MTERLEEPLCVTVIGDNFMLPAAFIESLERIRGRTFRFRTETQAWPDVDMTHGYPGDGLSDLKEFFGRPEDVVPLVRDARVLICHLAPVTAAVLAAAPRLALIGVSRGRPVNIDMRAARERAIPVVNTPGRNASAVAEFTIGMILAETRMITRGHTALAARGAWRGDLYRADRAGRELSEMTVGIIGYGHVGMRVVGHLKSFGCRILVNDPYVRLAPQDQQDGVRQASFATLLAESDVVSLHLPVTAESTGMIGKAEFAAMKDGAYFINTARGPLVDYDALYHALVAGRLGGAGIETFAIEPVPPDWPLLKLDNVTLTPHIAGASIKTVTNAAAMLAEEVRRFLEGAPLAHQV